MAADLQHKDPPPIRLDREAAIDLIPGKLLEMTRWQHCRQLYHGFSLACDVQQVEKDTCGGWGDFSDEELQQFCREIFGLTVEIG